MSYSDATRSTTDFIADRFAHGFLMTVGFALTVLAAILSATMRAPWALAPGLMGFTMFVAGRAGPPARRQ